jgi:hypothetical protein
VVGFVLIINSLPNDIQPQDDSLLQRQYVTVTPDQNAFADYSKASETLQYPDNKDKIMLALSSNTWDEVFVSATLTNNTTCFEHIRDGNTKPLCVVPRITSITNVIPYIGKWIKISRLLALKAEHERHHNQPDQAIITIKTLLKFALNTEREPGDLLSYMVAAENHKVALKTIRNLVRSGMLNSNQLSELQNMLQNNSPSAQAPILVLQTEYEVFSNLIDDIAQGKVPLDDAPILNGWIGRFAVKHLFHPNRTKHDMAEFYTAFIQQSTNCYAQINLDYFDNFFDKKINQWEDIQGLDKLKIPNPAGTIFCSLLCSSSSSLITKKTNLELCHRATLLIIALHKYKLTHGYLPKTVAELVPDTISTIPLDPYDNKPLRYSRDKSIIYSVGKDLKDSGGSTQLPPDKSTCSKRKRWETEDIVFDIEKPKSSKTTKQSH